MRQDIDRLLDRARALEATGDPGAKAAFLAAYAASDDEHCAAINRAIAAGATVAEASRMADEAGRADDARYLAARGIR